MTTGDTAENRLEGQPIWRWVGLTAAVMVGFVLIGFGFGGVRRGIGMPPPRPPLYGSWDPHLSVHLVVPVLATLVMVLVAWHWRKIPDRVVPFVSYVSTVAMSMAVAVSTGQHERMFFGYERPKEAAEASIVFRLGLRAYVVGYGDREVPQVLDNHPAGRVVTRAVLQEIFGSGVVGPSIVMCMLAGLVVFPAWLLARELGGEGVARVTVLLLAVAPAVLLFGWASWEGVEAPLIITAAFLLARGLKDEVPRRGWALAGGLMLGVSTFWTYSGAFLGLAVILLVLVPSRGRDWRKLLAPGLGLAIGLVLLLVVVGDNVIYTYLVSRDSADVRIEARIANNNMRNYPYWLVGGPMAWLIGAGPPMVALGVLALRRIPWTRALLAIVGPLVLFASLPAQVTSLIPGELERTWLWVYPFVAIAAAAALVQVLGRVQVDAQWPRLVPGLVAVSAGTAILIQVLWMLPA